MAFGENFLRDTSGSPGRARCLHLAHSGSQSQHSIWVILPTCRASHIIKRLCIWWIALSTFQTMSAITLTKSEVRQWSVISGNRPQTSCSPNYLISQVHWMFITNSLTARLYILWALTSFSLGPR